MEDKKSLRAEVRRRIKLMSDEEKQRNAATIFAKVEATVAFANANCIALFVALWDEVPTTEALERWRAMGKRVVVPASRAISCATTTTIPTRWLWVPSVS